MTYLSQSIVLQPRTWDWFLETAFAITSCFWLETFSSDTEPLPCSSWARSTTRHTSAAQCQHPDILRLHLMWVPTRPEQN